MLDLPVSQDNIKSKITKIINEKDIAVTKGQRVKISFLKNIILKIL